MNKQELIILLNKAIEEIYINNGNKPVNDYERGQKDAIWYVIDLLEEQEEEKS